MHGFQASKMKTEVQNEMHLQTSSRVLRIPPAPSSRATVASLLTKSTRLNTKPSRRYSSCSSVRKQNKQTLLYYSNKRRIMKLNLLSLEHRVDEQRVQLLVGIVNAQLRRT